MGGWGGERAQIRHFLPSVSLSEVTVGWLCPCSSPGEFCVALSFWIPATAPSPHPFRPKGGNSSALVHFELFHSPWCHPTAPTPL